MRTFTRWELAAFLVVSLVGTGCAGDEPGAPVDGTDATTTADGITATEVAADAVSDAIEFELPMIRFNEVVVPDVVAEDIPLIVQDPCAIWQHDLSVRNLKDINSLGLLLSHTVAVGKLGVAVLEANDGENPSYEAPFAIETMVFGPTFLEGKTVHVHFDAEEIASLTLPGEVIIGFDSNAFPTFDDDGGISWWSKKVILSAANKADYEGAMGYAAHLPEWAAVVKIVGQDEDRTRFQVVEALAGDMPAEVHTNWSKSVFAAPFPAVSEALYLASFSYLSKFEPEGIYLGTTVDFRPLTAEAKAALKTALAGPKTLPDYASARAVADDYALSWAFHRSEEVLAAKVTGIAGECCTGAGGTYFEYDVEANLRTTEPPDRFMLGGHGYYSGDRCNDVEVIGLNELAGKVPPEPNAFGCDLRSGPSLDTGIAVPQVRARIPDSVAGRQKVAGWLAAREPLYRLHPSTSTPTATDQDGDAPWSQPLTMEAALLAGALIRITVVDVVESGGQTVVTLKTNFSPYDYDHLTNVEVKLAFKCGDDRLRQKGAVWLAPIVYDGPAYEPSPVDKSGAFLVPGILLPEFDSYVNIAGSYGYAAVLALTPQP